MQRYAKVVMAAATKSDIYAMPCYARVVTVALIHGVILAHALQYTANCRQRQQDS